MSTTPDRFASRRDILAFVSCLVLAVAARLAPVEVQNAVSAGIRSTIVAPFLSLEQQVVLLKASRANFARMVAQRDSALVRALAVRSLSEENERLRELLRLGRRLPMRHVTAEILHQAGRTEGLTFVLSVGRDDGVLQHAPVVAPEGLVGVIQSVDASISIAIGWPHPDFRVSAVTLDRSVFGIVAPLGSEGPNTMVLELRGVPYGEPVPEGTIIYTSGLGGSGGVYPHGIPIGSVLSVAEEQEGWSRTYRVRPAVHPASVSHVLVLMGPSLDLQGAFDGEGQ